ncbi:hypothetical protein DER30_1042 [Streptomyces sp. HB202]|nr:hypothetical protein DER30_1042 [Streptomyces sp. HB202]GGW13774.1 hypothetical protein GCM10010264_55310 [Streptomyces globisporus]
MTILKTYARLWADDLDQALPLLEELTGEQPHLRTAFEEIALAAIGNFLVIAGPAEERARYTHASATVVVDDLGALRATLKSAGRHDHHSGDGRADGTVPLRPARRRSGDRVRRVDAGAGPQGHRPLTATRTRERKPLSW